MRYCELNECDIANGPGCRVSLFVSGCEHHCKGCFSPQTWDPSFGNEFTTAVADRLVELVSRNYISGLSVLGGDPLMPCNRRCVAELLGRIRGKFGAEKNVWVWTGYTLHEINCENEHFANEILRLADVLVDGPFVEAERDFTLPFRGSRNQNIVHLHF